VKDLIDVIDKIKCKNRWIKKLPKYPWWKKRM